VWSSHLTSPVCFGGKVDRENDEGNSNPVKPQRRRLGAEKKYFCTHHFVVYIKILHQVAPKDIKFVTTVKQHSASKVPFFNP
jgi:hypothetical protein